MRPRLPWCYARFTLEGLNIERFLRLAAEGELPLLSARREGPRRMVCECYQADLPAFRALIEEKGWRMLGSEPLFLSAAAAALKRRWGLPVGLALMMLAAAALYQFVWRVELIGAGAYQGDLRAFLAESRVTVGRLKRAVDTAALEQALYARYPKLAWFSVYLHDVTLTVECSRGVPQPDAPDESPGDLVASRDGVIAAVEVYAGTAAVKPGDIVRAGQVLIAGTERSAGGALAPVRAEGRVWARCWVSRSATIPAAEVISAPTGRAEACARLRTPWASWPPAEDAPAYLAFDREVTALPVVGCFFPVWAEKTIYREVALEYAPRDEGEVRGEAAEAALRKLSLAVPADETVDKWVDYCMIEGDSCTATATAETVLDIAQAAPRPP